MSTSIRRVGDSPVTGQGRRAPVRVVLQSVSRSTFFRLLFTISEQQRVASKTSPFGKKDQNDDAGLEALNVEISSFLVTLKTDTGPDANVRGAVRRAWLVEAVEGAN